MKSAVTIKDIAEQLGLSRNTVAKALNGKYVPESTRRQVLEKARELNYKSMGNNDNGGNARNRRILLLSGKPLSNLNFFVPIIRSIENFCYARRHELFQYTFNADAMTFQTLADYIRNLNPDGIIAIETFNKEFIQNLIDVGLPLAFIDFAAVNVPVTGNYDIVHTDNIRPIFALTRNLILQYGIKKFCFVGDITHCRSFQDRYFGMLQGLMSDNIPHTAREDILRSDTFLYGSVAAIKSEITKLRDLPECFICANDFIARSVCNTLADMNIKIPSRCRVVGYDNAIEATAAHPTITTFGCNNEHLGLEAINTLLRRITDKDITYTRQITINVKQFNRTSTNSSMIDNTPPRI